MAQESQLMLDLNTLRLVSALSFACFAFGTVLLWRLVPDEIGLKDWAKATTLIFAALLLLGLRSFIPDFISITIANSLMTLGIGFLYIGTRNLINIRTNHQWHWLAAGVAFLICLSPNVSVRVVGTSIIQVPYFAACAWMFWYSKDEHQLIVIKRISALIFALGIVMFIARIVNPPSASTSSLYINTHSLIEVIPYFYAIAFSMWLSLTLLLLVSIRLQNQRTEALAKAEAINQALVESESYLRTILNKEPDCISVIGADGNLIEINPAGLATFEAESIAQLSGSHLLNAVTPEFRKDLIDMHKRVLTGESVQLEFDAISLKGRHLRLHTNAVPMQANGEIVLLAVTRDITNQKISEQTLIESEKMYRSLFDTTSDAMFMLDENGFFDGNKAALQLFGIQSKEELLQYHPAQLSTPKQSCGMDSFILAENYIKLAQQSGTAHFEWVHKRADTNEPFVADVLLSAFTIANKQVLQATVRDITARKKSEEQVLQLAFYDTLTKLPNRRLLNDRLSQLMVASKRTGSHGALMFLDLDNFKPLNDTYGHEVGDLLLMEAASRITNCIREMDTVVRFGGDEFVVLLGELNQDKSMLNSQATIVAEKIREVLSEPYVFTIAKRGQIDLSIEHRCTGSIGIVIFNGSVDRQEDLIKWADTAMYEAKSAGRNQIRVYLN